MNKREIINSLNENYKTFMDYIDNLEVNEYNFQYQQKWSAGQQLEHIVLCVKPLVQIFGMPPAMIENTFGRKRRTDRSYDGLLKEYLEKLNDGGKAPQQYIPVTEKSKPKEVLLEKLAKYIHILCSKIEAFSDEDLDSLLVPHPLLGILTLREMLYNVIYHVTHHQKQAEENLKNK